MFCHRHTQTKSGQRYLLPGDITRLKPAIAGANLVLMPQGPDSRRKTSRLPQVLPLSVAKKGTGEYIIHFIPFFLLIS
jgi:hypothetical protein